MIKTPPSPLRHRRADRRSCSSCVLVLTYLWISFGGSIPFAAQGYRIEVAFPQANELADRRRRADRRRQRRQGRRPEARPARQPHAGDAPDLSGSTRRSPRDTRATLRIKTLLGETYVELSAGNPQRAGCCADGGTAARRRRSSPTSTLDQILSTFDPDDARRVPDLDAVPGGGGGRDAAQDINASFGTLPHVRRLGRAACCRRSTRQSAAVRGLVANTGEFFNAISARRGRAVGPDHGRQQPVPDHRPAQPGRSPTCSRRCPNSSSRAALTLPALTRSPSRPTRSCARLSRSPPQLTRTLRRSPSSSRPQLRSAVRAPRPDRHRFRARPARARQHPATRSRRCSARSSRSCATPTRWSSYIGAVQARDHRLLRQRHRRLAGLRPTWHRSHAARRSTTCGPRRR